MYHSTLHIYRTSLVRSVLGNQRSPRDYFDDWPPAHFDTTSWLDVEKWINHVGFKSPETDSIFRKLLNQIAVLEDSHHEQELFLFLAWQSLEQLNISLMRIDPGEPLERWSNLSRGFIRTIRRFELDKRPQFLGRKILNDAQYDARAEYRKYFLSRGTDIGEKILQETIDLPSKDNTADLAEFNSSRRFLIDQLRALVDAKEICAEDFDVLVMCVLNERPICEFAKNANQKYGTIKRRRLRALKKIKKHAPHLSPENPNSPLLGLSH